MIFGEDFGQLAASGEYEVYKKGTTIAQLNAAIASLSDEEYYDSFLIANTDAVSSLFTLSPIRDDERQYTASVVSSTSNLSYAIFWQQDVLYYRVKTISSGTMNTVTKSTSGTGDTLLTLNSWTLYRRQKGYDVANGGSNVAYAIAPVQTSLSSADKNYAVGEQFLYDGHLYRVTAAITSGAQIVIGTNAEAAGSIAEQTMNVIPFTLELSSDASSKATISRQACYRIGRLVFISISMNVTTAIPSQKYITTTSSRVRPLTNSEYADTNSVVVSVDATNTSLYLFANGGLFTRDGVPTGGHMWTFMYIAE